MGLDSEAKIKKFIVSLLVWIALFKEGKGHGI